MAHAPTSSRWGWALPSRRLTLSFALAALLLATGPAPAGAEVFASKQEALATAFPDAERIDRRSLVLSDAQAERIEQVARARLESRLVTLYIAIQDDAVSGYALIDVHQVRTLPEAFMVVLSPEGEIRSVRILAFYEPPEYKPSDRWLAQFEDREDREAGFQLGSSIHGIAGSTLSARAVTSGVRRSLALFEVLVTGQAAPVAIHEKAAGPAGGGR